MASDAEIARASLLTYRAGHLQNTQSLEEVLKENTYLTSVLRQRDGQLEELDQQWKQRLVEAVQQAIEELGDGYDDDDDDADDDEQYSTPKHSKSNQMPSFTIPMKSHPQPNSSMPMPKPMQPISSSFIPVRSSLKYFLNTFIEIIPIAIHF